MDFEELIVRNRSYRRFDGSKKVSRQALLDLVDLARRTPSAANRQPLKYLLVDGEAERARLFESLHWAGALKDWPGPAEGERPAAYVVVLLDTDIASEAGCDHGIAAQSMLLGAVERGLGGCMLGAIERPKIRADFRLPDRFRILLVVALGVPAETCRLEETGPGGDTTYYRDAEGVHHVPKRPLHEVLVEF
jgi:nitroreductase